MANTHSLDLESSSSQYAFRNDSGSLSISGNLTFECWVKFESLPSSGNYYPFVSKWTAGNSSYIFRMDNSSGTYRLILTLADGVGADNITKALSFVPSTGVWYHFGVTWLAASSLAEFYVNGESIGTVTGTVTSIVSSAANFEIGRADSSSFFDGLIDDVRIFNIVRTDEQILTNYIPDISSSTTGLQAYYKLDNDYNDATTNAYHLTSSGSPVFSTNITTTTLVAKTVSLIYLILSYVAKTKTLVYTMLSYVSKTKTLTYNILNFVSQTKSFMYTIVYGVPISKSLLLRYNVLGTVGKRMLFSGKTMTEALFTKKEPDKGLFTAKVVSEAEWDAPNPADPTSMRE